MSYGDGEPVPPEMVAAIEAAQQRRGGAIPAEMRRFLDCPWCWVSVVGRDGKATRDAAQASHRILVTPCIRHGGPEDPLDPLAVRGVPPIPLFRLHPRQDAVHSQVDKDWGLVARARDFGGAGSWGRLEDGSWDIVVPVRLQLRRVGWPSTLACGGPARTHKPWAARGAGGRAPPQVPDMGHDSFAYIADVTDHSPASLRRAFEDLRLDPPPSGEAAYTGTGGYTISDKGTVRVASRPVDLTDADLDRVARGVIRNLNASARFHEEPQDPFAIYAWDDADARGFFLAHAGKWEPAIAMPLPGRRAFVFGMVGG
ncbi:MAG: hypothetical protein LC620_01235 [Halobacteriales archaeon]|nr:hypothetical protein [Halobacteriales archaeon]